MTGEPIAIPGGWRLELPGTDGQVVMFEVTAIERRKNDVHAKLRAWPVQGGTGVFKNGVNLSSAKVRRQAAKTLKTRHLPLDDCVVAAEAALEVLEAACEQPTAADVTTADAAVERAWIRRTARYGVDDRGLFWLKDTGPQQLTNFRAAIVADVVADDGVELRRHFEIETTFKRITRQFSVPAEQFAGMSWVARELGAAAYVCPGPAVRDHVRVAIPDLSGDIPEERRFAHTGWRKVDGEWLYLHAGGAIGAAGARTDVAVHLSGALTRYTLPAPPVGATLVAAVRASRALLGLGGVGVTAAVFGLTYLAPLRELLLGSTVPDFVGWIVGPSGEFKTEMAALALAHSGEFDRLSLPASFRDTGNSLERLAFTLKDNLLVVDDYHPANDVQEARKMAQLVAWLLRGVGNGAGRNRLTADLQLRPELSPRGVVLATGERLPSGYSTLARLFPIFLAPGEIAVDRLTAAQATQAQYAPAMAGYVQFLARHFDTLKEELPGRFRTLRDRARAEGAGAREPGQVAHLFLGLEVWSRFAVAAGAITRAQADAELEAQWAALLALGAEQREQLVAEKPERRFLALLAGGFASKRAYLETKAGGIPTDADEWGWEACGDGEVRHAAGAMLVGKLDGDWMLLDPEAVFQFVSMAARNAGETFPVEPKTLWKRLDEEGWIATETDTTNGHTTVRRTVRERIGKTLHRFVKLAVRALVPAMSSGTGCASGTSSPEQNGRVSPRVPDVPDVPGHREGAPQQSDSDANSESEAIV